MHALWGCGIDACLWHSGQHMLNWWQQPAPPHMHARPGRDALACMHGRIWGARDGVKPAWGNIDSRTCGSRPWAQSACLARCPELSRYAHLSLTRCAARPWSHPPPRPSPPPSARAPPLATAPPQAAAPPSTEKRTAKRRSGRSVRTRIRTRLRSVIGTGTGTASGIGIGIQIGIGRSGLVVMRRSMSGTTSGADVCHSLPEGPKAHSA